MASMALLQISSPWPRSKSRLIHHPLSATWLRMPWWASQAAGLAWLACLDLSVDPMSQISSTCKSSQIYITSKNNTKSTRSIHTALHIFYICIKFRQTSCSGQGYFVRNKNKCLSVNLVIDHCNSPVSASVMRVAAIFLQCGWDNLSYNQRMSEKFKNLKQLLSRIFPVKPYIFQPASTSYES
jgi:hypothetical protein